MISVDKLCGEPVRSRTRSTDTRVVSWIVVGSIGLAALDGTVGALASAGGELLIVAGYVDQGGRGIVQGALEPLVAVFVLSVFVTFTISQWAMLRHAINRRRSGPGW